MHSAPSSHATPQFDESRHSTKQLVSVPLQFTSMFDVLLRLKVQSAPSRQEPTKLLAVPSSSAVQVVAPPTQSTLQLLVPQVKSQLSPAQPQGSDTSQSSTHAPGQLERHAPAVQTSPAEHPVPHAPQFIRSSSRLASHPSDPSVLQSAKPESQVSTQAPVPHPPVALVVSQTASQAPQFAGSVVGTSQPVDERPSQSRNPAWQM